MSRRHRWNRRQWIWTAAVATGAAAVLPRRSFASPGRVLGSPAVGPVHEAVDTKLKAFPLSQVRLRPGIFLDQLESNQSFIESLPNDRLLHTFRLTAGIPSSADPLGGWEHPRGELRGHFTGGHVLSACALLSAATGDDAIKQKGDVLVAELAKCQQKLNQDGYLSAYPTNFYDRLKEGKRVWAPFYTYHKILAGHFGYVHALRKRAGSMRTTTTGAMASVRSKRGRSASTFIGAVTRKTEVLGRTNSLACAG